MGKYDSPENATNGGQMVGCLLGKIPFKGPDFLSVELVESTSVIIGSKCNKGRSVITFEPKCNKDFICHD